MKFKKLAVAVAVGATLLACAHACEYWVQGSDDFGNSLEGIANRVWWWTSDRFAVLFNGDIAHQYSVQPYEETFRLARAAGKGRGFVQVDNYNDVCLAASGAWDLIGHFSVQAQAFLSQASTCLYVPIADAVMLSNTLVQRDAYADERSFAFCPPIGETLMTMREKGFESFMGEVTGGQCRSY